MSNINHLLIESFNAAYNPVLNRQLNNPPNNTDTVGKYINYGSLAAALYHIFSTAKNAKENKIGAALNAIPSAAMKAFAFALSGHAIKDLAKGNYQPPGNHVSNKSTSYFDSMIKGNQSYLNSHQNKQKSK